MHKKKNQALDLIKLMAAYMVVFIHVPFPDVIDPFVDSIARFAVPLFFFVSGFFSYGITTEKIKKRIIHILKLFLVATVIYTIKNLAVLIIQKDTQGLIQYFLNYTNIKTLIKLFVFNWAVASGLWHFLALLYVYIIFYFVTKFAVRDKIVFLVAFLCLGVHLALGEMCAAIGIAVPPVLIRNFQMFGVPFFGIGLLIKKHSQRVENFTNTYGTWLIPLAMVLGVAESVISRLLFGLSELHVGSLLILAAWVMLSFKYSDKTYPKGVNALTECSTNLYIFHPLLSPLMGLVYTYVLGLHYSQSVVLQWLHPIIVCVTTTILALGINGFQSWVARKKSKV